MQSDLDQHCLQDVHVSRSSAGGVRTVSILIHEEFFFNGFVKIRGDRFGRKGGGAPQSLVVMCLTRNEGVLGLSRNESFEFFVGVSLGKTLQSPSLVLGKPRKGMYNVSCCRDVTNVPGHHSFKHGYFQN